MDTPESQSSYTPGPWGNNPLRGIHETWHGSLAVRKLAKHLNTHPKWVATKLASEPDQILPQLDEYWQARVDDPVFGTVAKPTEWPQATIEMVIDEIRHPKLLETPLASRDEPT